MCQRWVCMVYFAWLLRWCSLDLIKNWQSLANTCKHQSLLINAAFSQMVPIRCIVVRIWSRRYRTGKGWIKEQSVRHFKTETTNSFYCVKERVVGIMMDYPNCLCFPLCFAAGRDFLGGRKQQRKAAQIKVRNMEMATGSNVQLANPSYNAINY